MTAIVTAARALIGAPWRHMGRSARGVDCIGLVVLSYRAAGHDVPDPAPYAREPQGHAIIAGLAAAGARRVRPGEEQDGDVLVFRLEVTGGHVGIRASGPGGATVVHAYLARGRVVEEPLSHDLADAFIAAYRRGEG